MTTISWTEILIAASAAVVMAVTLRIIRARRAKRDRGPSHIHEPLMKRAEAYADNGHISNRQAEAVRKAIRRIEAR
jgi:hypothetical protein